METNLLFLHSKINLINKMLRDTTTDFSNNQTASDFINHLESYNNKMNENQLSSFLFGCIMLIMIDLKSEILKISIAVIFSKRYEMFRIIITMYILVIYRTRFFSLC